MGRHIEENESSSKLGKLCKAPKSFSNRHKNHQKAIVEKMKEEVWKELLFYEDGAKFGFL